MDTFIDLFEILCNISVFFQSDFKQYMVMNKQNAGCSHIFWGHSGTCTINHTSMCWWQNMLFTFTRILSELLLKYTNISIHFDQFMEGKMTNINFKITLYMVYLPDKSGIKWWNDQVLVLTYQLLRHSKSWYHIRHCCITTHSKTTHPLCIYKFSTRRRTTEIAIY